VLGQHLGDGRRQRRFAMIDVPDRPDIQVRLVSLEFSFAIDSSPRKNGLK